MDNLGEQRVRFWRPGEPGANGITFQVADMAKPLASVSSVLNKESSANEDDLAGSFDQLGSTPAGSLGLSPKVPGLSAKSTSASRPHTPAARPPI